MNKPKTTDINPSQILYRAFPGSFRNLPDVVVKINRIRSGNGDTVNEMTNVVLKQIAKRISQHRQVQESHQREVQKRRNQNESVGSAVPSAQIDDDFLDSIFGEGVNEELKMAEDNSEHELSPSIRQNDLTFIEIDSSTSVQTQVFPHSFHCKNCGHYHAIDPRNLLSSLLCPCCKTAYLRQEPIVFGCARCATIAELAPPGEKLTDNVGEKKRKSRRLADFLGDSPPCPDCKKGHLHLEKHRNNSVKVWEWKCTRCVYSEGVGAQCLDCAMPSAGGEQSSIISMNAFPATASNALSALTDKQLFIERKPLNPDTLYALARQAGANWSDYFDLQQKLQQSPAGVEPLHERLTDACIHNVYLVRRLNVVTTVYGYRAGSIMNHSNSPVPDQEKHACFFPDPDRIVQYLCYGVTHEGSAMVLEFDPVRLVERLERLSPDLSGLDYQQIVKRERLQVANVPLRDLLLSNHRTSTLFSSLHAIEHALLTCAHQLIGSEVLGSVLFFEQGMILLYERESIGRGGIVQLVNQGMGLMHLIDASVDHVFGCAQGCVQGCPSCIFVSDSHCHIRVEDLERNWLPVNTLLSRAGAHHILALGSGI